MAKETGRWKEAVRAFTAQPFPPYRFNLKPEIRGPLCMSFISRVVCLPWTRIKKLNIFSKSVIFIHSC